MQNGEEWVWEGRNPAYPDVRGTFGAVVGVGILEAWNHPARQVRPDQPSIPSTMVPIEFTNFHALAVGANVTGRERLEQTAWLIHFAYEDKGPRIIGIVKED